MKLGIVLLPDRKTERGVVRLSTEAETYGNGKPLGLKRGDRRAHLSFAHIEFESEDVVPQIEDALREAVGGMTALELTVNRLEASGVWLFASVKKTPQLEEVQRSCVEACRPFWVDEPEQKFLTDQWSPHFTYGSTHPEQPPAFMQEGVDCDKPFEGTAVAITDLDDFGAVVGIRTVIRLLHND